LSTPGRFDHGFDQARLAAQIDRRAVVADWRSGQNPDGVARVKDRLLAEGGYDAS
jgi:hypothetical protein